MIGLIFLLVLLLVLLLGNLECFANKDPERIQNLIWGIRMANKEGWDYPTFLRRTGEKKFHVVKFLIMMDEYKKGRLTNNRVDEILQS